MIKILTILGARPQFIKAGSVSREIGKHKEIEEIIVHTGQHYDTNMSDIFFDEMQIPKPNYFLGIGGKSHGAMTGQMIEKIEEVALKEKPDWIMVYGDTNSTLAGAIVSSKLHIKLAHIEAGLRSFNMKMPEEVNRILTDRVSNILFCPTDTAIQNLKNEGFEVEEESRSEKTEGRNSCFGRVVKVGDVMQDGAMFYKNISTKPSTFNLQPSNFILCTIHRAENTDDETRLKSIFEALNEIAKEKQVILPIHPRTKKILENLKLDINNLTIIEPVGYLEMVWLIDNCDFVMTDSGGLQKEAYFFEKQCITLRDETEWIELVECGANTLVGADKNKIIEAYRNNSEFNKQNSKLDLYGGGRASENIVKELLKYQRINLKRKIVHLTSVHGRHDIRIFLKECSSLVKAEYDVSFVVSDGLGNEEKNGVKIYDVGKQNGRINRILNTTKNVFKKCVELNADLYHFHDPELIPTGLKLKKLKKKVIFDSHEDFASDILTKDYIPSVLRFFISSAFKIYDTVSCKKFDVIVTATKAISEIYKNRGCKTIVINNYPILDELNTSANVEKEKICCFAGAQNKIRGIKELVIAAGQIDGKLYLAGPKTGAFEDDLKSLDGWKNVVDLGNLPRQKLANLLGKSSVGLVTYLPAPNHVDAQPNKLFEYMSVGLPVIASNFDLWKEIIEKNYCGICVDPANPKEIAKAIKYIFDNPKEAKIMGQNGKENVDKIYNWKVEENKLIELYKGLLNE